jgi:hypothetical protein
MVIKELHALLALRRCWTVDRLLCGGIVGARSLPLMQVARRNPRPSIPWLHLLAGWVGWRQGHARSPFSLLFDVLSEWWPTYVGLLPVALQKEANSLISLVLRCMWLEHNATLWESTSLQTIDLVVQEWCLWLTCCGHRERYHET